MKVTKSSTEIRIGHRYSVRRDGETSWADCDNIRSARKLQVEGDRLSRYGHKIVDNRTGEIAEGLRRPSYPENGH